MPPKELTKLQQITYDNLLAVKYQSARTEFDKRVTFLLETYRADKMNRCSLREQLYDACDLLRNEIVR